MTDTGSRTTGEKKTGPIISGTYHPQDVTFLLKPVQLAATEVAVKEKLIQSGAAHYSEMISEERRPDARYLAIFEQACINGEHRIAREISTLARVIAERIDSGLLESQITLCSLVRAGVPYGVLLQRELTAIGIDSKHFGVSIIRDKGLDRNAMQFIFKQRPLEGVVFVDGWTGKGAISNELAKSWLEITGRQSPELVVLADPGGFASLSASHEDWLIPSGILGASVSGLISRSILNKAIIGPDDFHGSVPVSHLADIDVSLKFVDRITELIQEGRGLPEQVQPAENRQKLRADVLQAVDSISSQYMVKNYNRIKPGIAEATRAVLRRKPHRVFIRSLEDPDLKALIHLCNTDQVQLVEDATLTGPFRAITLIEKTA